jgi:endonuclease YncB( thermonuclease family)
MINKEYNKKHNRRLIRAFIILVFTVLGSLTLISVEKSNQNYERVRVTKVIDGDSIVIKTSKGQRELRIWGIDAPEKNQPYYDEAKRKLTELVDGKIVRIQNPKTDSLNRDLAFISIENFENFEDSKIKENINKLIPAEHQNDVGSILLGLGLAWHLNPDPEHDKPYKILENQAKINKVGLWVDPNPKRPEDHRREIKNKSPKTFNLNEINEPNK